MKSERDAAVGASRISSLPPSSRGRGPAGQNPEPVTAGPPKCEMRETKGKQTGLEPGARCRVCPPPRRARMMDGCSQPARPPGRPRYLHNTGVPPVTSDTALPGAEARWPRGSSSHPRTETACEGPARPGEPSARGREGQQPGLGSGPGASSLPASHGRRRAGSFPGERTSRAFKSTRFPKHELQAELPGRAGSSHSGQTALRRAGHGTAGRLSPGTTDAPLPHAALNTFQAQSQRSTGPQPISSLRMNLRLFYRGHLFLPGSNGQCGSNSLSPSSRPTLGTRHDWAQPRVTRVPGAWSPLGGRTHGSGKGSGLTL